MAAVLLVPRFFGVFTDPWLTSSEIHAVEGEPKRASGPAPPPALTVVTWNIQYGGRFDHVLAALRRFDADVYLLQEVDAFCRRSGNRHVARDLADALGLNWIFAGEFQELGETVGARPGLTGQAILSRYPITGAVARRLTAQAWARWHLNPLQPRRGGRVVLEADIAGTRVYDVHLESGANASLRRRQLAEIMRHDAARQPQAAILAGDFNNSDGATDTWRALSAAGFSNALSGGPAAPTTKRPRAFPIDWIFVRGWRARDGRTIGVDGASDHHPLVVTLFGGPVP